MARPKPSVLPVQTGSHRRAERCVETWTASVWLSSSCPSSQPQHQGPQAWGGETTNIIIVITSTCIPILIIMPIVLIITGYIHTPPISLHCTVNYCSAASAHFLQFFGLLIIVFAHSACGLIVMYPKCKHCRMKDTEWQRDRPRETDRKTEKENNKQQCTKKNMSPAVCAGFTRESFSQMSCDWHQLFY